MNKVYLVGPAGTGKSTRLAARLGQLVESNIRPDRILVLVPQQAQARIFRTELAQIKGTRKARGEPTITTIYGLGTPKKPHPLQTAYVQEQVPQCGYCVSGWVLTAAATLKNKPAASDAELREALSGLKCRCGTHVSIMRAVKRAQKMMA